MAWWKIKAYRNNLAKKRREDAGDTPPVPARPVEHPVMETHPGDRVKDPETGVKPKPVRKPRVKKPKPVEDGSVEDAPTAPSPETPSQPVDPSTSDATPSDPATTTDKPLTWGSEI